MPIYANAGDSKTFTPAPEGTHQAVCVDVIDKGVIKTAFGDKHKIDLAWELDEKREDGSRWMVFKRYTLSINEKANLRKDLETWRGKPFSRDEEMQFDVETVIGANCLVNVQHSVNGEKTYANVMSVMPLMKGMAKIAGSKEYIRICNRTDKTGHEAPPQVADEDTVPF